MTCSAPLYVLSGRFHFRSGVLWTTELYRGEEHECKRIAAKCVGGYSEFKGNPVRATDLVVSTLDEWERYLAECEA